MKRIKLFLALLGFITIGQVATAQTPGSTFTDPVVISTLPVLETQSTTCGFGNNYSTVDIACVGNFMSGEEKIYSYTPATNMPNMQVSMTNISDNFSGLFITDDSTATGTCLGSAYDPTNNDRVITNLSLNAGTTYYFIVSSWANPACLSFDFQVLDQTCPAPANIMTVGVGHDTASVSWTEMGSATQWEVEWGGNGFVPGTGTSMITSNNPFTITSLMANTIYDVYVTAVCGPGDSSYAVGPMTFTTTCTPVADFVEDFDLFPTYVVPTCWASAIESSNTGAYVETYQWSTPNSGSRHMRFYNGNDDSAKLTLVYPPLTNVSAGTHRTTFYAKNADAGILLVGTMSDPSDNSTFTAIDTIVTTPNYTKYFVEFDSYTGSDAYVAMMALPTTTFEYYYVDDVVWEAIPSCPAPRFLTATVTNTTANLGWYEAGSATNWEVEYGTPGFVQGAGTFVAATSNPFLLTSLTPNTAYEYYVRAACGANDSSVWVGPFAFATDCNPVTNPWLDDVEAHSTTTTADIGNCWTASPSNLTSAWSDYAWNVDGSGGSPGWMTGPNTAYSGSQFFYVSGNNGSGDDLAILTSPLVDLTGLTNPRVEFRYHMYGDNIGTLYVEALNGNNWVMIDSIVGQQQTSGADPWGLRVNYLVGYTGSTKIRFTAKKHPNYGRGDISLDDIQVMASPTCPEPTALTSDTATTSGATVSWQENGSATSWIIEYGPSGFAQGLGTVVAVTANPHVFTGLPSGTNYDFYVRATCSSTDTSAYSPLGSFATACAVENLPYTNNFNNWPLICWDMTGGSHSWFQYNSGGVNAARANNWSWSAGSDAYMTTPEINISADAQISFEWSHQYNATWQDSMSLQVKVLPNGTWTSIWGLSGAAFNSPGAGTTTPGTFVSETLVLDPTTYTGQTVQFRFEDISGWGPDVFVRDLLVEAVPTCLAPDSLMASNISATSLDFGWTEMNSATQWEVEYGPTGFIPGTGTVVTTTTNPLTVTGLTAQTSYTFCVRSVCGAADSSLFTCADFVTGCAPIADFVEDFDAVSTPDLPQCWNGYAVSTNQFANVESYNWSGPNSGTVHVRMTNSADVNAEMYLISPELSTVGTATHRLRFFAKDFDANTFEVGTMSDPNDPTTFTSRATVTPTASYLEYFVSFGAYSGTDGYVAIKANHAATYDYLYIDDVVWETRPSCMRPSNMNVTFTSTTATASWIESASATQWELEYGAPGFALGTGTTLLTSNNPETITGLTAATDYEIYVRAVCGANDSSVAIGPVSFTTHCLSAATPYLDDVESHNTTTNSSIANCWSSSPTGTTSSLRWNVDGSGSTPSGSTGPSGAYSGSKYFYLEASQGAQGAVAELYSPLIDVTSLTLPRIQFYFHMYGASMGALYIDVHNNGAWVNDVDSIVGQQHAAATDPWKLKNIYLPGYSGDIQIRFRGVKGSSFTGDISLDDIVVNEAPSCVEPVGLTVSNIMDVSVDLGWTNPGTATSFVVEYGSPGFTLGTGTTVTTSANPYAVTGLTPDSDYEFYVRAVCAPGDSSMWSLPVSASTICSVFASPFLEDVEGHAANSNGEIDNCWSQDGGTGYISNWNVSQTGASTWANTGPSSAHSGNKYFYFESSPSTTGEASLYSPMIDVSTMALPKLKYMYHMYGATMGTLYAEINDGTGWVIVDSIVGEQQTAGSDPWLAKDITLPTLSGTSIQVRFRGVRGGSTSDFALDDIEIVDTFSENLAVLSVETAGDICGLGTDSVKVTFTNEGTASQSGFPITYELGINTTTETYTATINAGDTVTYTFNTLANFTSPGMVDITAYTALVGDSALSNDTVMSQVGKTLLVSVFPYEEDFAAGEAGWIIDNGQNGSFAFGNPAGTIIDGAASDTNAFVTNLTGNYNSQEDAYVYSPCFDFSTLVKPYVQMSINYESYTSDGASLDVSTDGGMTWNTLGDMDSGTNWYSFSDWNYGFVWTGRGNTWTPQGSNGWKVATIAADSLAGMSDVKFRVHFFSNNSTWTLDEGFAFDDFAIYEAATLGDDTVLCTNDTLTLNPGVYSGYLWSDSTIIPVQYLDAAVMDEGIDTIDVIVSGPNGFKMYDTVVITVEKPVIALGTDTVVCFGESVTLDAGTGFATYVWSDMTTGQTTTTVGNVAGATDYSVVGLTPLGCPAADTINVTVNTEVLVDLGKDTMFYDELLQGTEYLLDAGPGFASYLWSDGSTNQTLLIDSNQTSTLYTVVVTNASGCTGTDTVIVEFNLSVDGGLAVSTISMYPNPTTDMINISVSNFTALGDVEVKVLDITGKVVMKETLEGSGSEFKETYDVTSLATGTYFVQFEAQGEVVTRQFVIK